MSTGQRGAGGRAFANRVQNDQNESVSSFFAGTTRLEHFLSPPEPRFTRDDPENHYANQFDLQTFARSTKQCVGLDTSIHRVGNYRVRFLQNRASFDTSTSVV